MCAILLLISALTAATTRPSATPAATPTPTPTPQVTAVPPAPAADPLIGIAPKSNPWSGEMTEYDRGWCGGVADGYGWTGNLVWPTDSRTIDPDRGFRPGHGAIDILAETGAPVYAAESGLVVWAGFSRWGGGEMVVLGHGGSYQTHYAHMSVVSVACGDYVGKGQVIGAIGRTGAASVPHLHFIVRSGGLNYDPLHWLN